MRLRVWCSGVGGRVHRSVRSVVGHLERGGAAEHDAAVRLLEQRGPGLGRPLVDSIVGSRHANMKELRASTLRVLFAFDPRRSAILLIGGDKRDRWQEFYEEMIPLADDLFDE